MHSEEDYENGRKNEVFERPGADVLILKIFSQIFFKNLIITLVFEKNANFFAQNRQNSQKIAIITSTPESFFTGWLSFNDRSLFFEKWLFSF
jgi:hypothetical protein